MDASLNLVMRRLEGMKVHFTELLPHLPLAATVTAAAIIPIFTGAHASLSRPSTAAKPSKHPDSKSRSRSSADRLRQGLTPADALLLPVACGILLTGIYLLIKWLEDPTLLNKIITIQQSLMGTVAIWQFVNDGQTLFYTWIFPRRYSRANKVWNIVDGERKLVVDQGREDEVILSPLPGRLSRISLPSWLSRMIWAFREARTQPYGLVEVFVKGMGHTVMHLHDSAEIAAVVALVVVFYCNFVSKPWWLTNLYGFSFCYSGLQILSPTTFWTGSMILTALFFYDICFVFYTPIMIEVATKLDIPGGLLSIPNPIDIGRTDEKRRNSILGLGDVILPGMMLCLALRFDLYMFYLKKQKPRSVDLGNHKDINAKLTKEKSKLVKAEYVQATGTWGDRFWLDSKAFKATGGYFPRPYFTAGMIGYIIGMSAAQTVMHIFKHGQPALLYLVPGVLGSLWGTALIKGEIKHMWMYTEDEDAEKSKKSRDSSPAEKQENTKAGNSNIDAADSKVTKSISNEDDEHNVTSQPTKQADSARSSNKKTTEGEDRRIFYISISEPEISKAQS